MGGGENRAQGSGAARFGADAPSRLLAPPALRRGDKFPHLSPGSESSRPGMSASPPPGAAARLRRGPRTSARGRARPALGRPSPSPCAPAGGPAREGSARIPIRGDAHARQEEGNEAREGTSGERARRPGGTTRERERGRGRGGRARARRGSGGGAEGQKGDGAEARRGGGRENAAVSPRLASGGARKARKGRTAPRASSPRHPAHARARVSEQR